MVWVIMRRRGVSSERRCSSCSSCGLVKPYGDIRVPTGSGKPGKINFSGKVMESHGILKNRQKSWKSHGTSFWDFCGNPVTQIWVNIGSGSGLLSEGTKPSPVPILTYCKWSLVAFSWQQFYRRNSKTSGHKISFKTTPLKLLPHLLFSLESKD